MSGNQRISTELLGKRVEWVELIPHPGWLYIIRKRVQRTGKIVNVYLANGHIHYTIAQEPDGQLIEYDRHFQHRELRLIE